MDVKKIFNNKGLVMEGVLLFTPKLFPDKRGVFFENWNKNNLSKFIGSKNFVQDNISISNKYVIRGMHYQLNPSAQGKLISTINGAIYDVIIDLRRSSRTFKSWAGVNLDSKNKTILWIPSGFAHGFLSLEDNTIVNYKVDNYWNKSLERSLKWDDSEIKIKWPDLNGNLQFFNISDKDNDAKSFEEIEEEGAIFE